MQGDIRIYEPVHEVKAKFIYDNIKNLNRPLVLSIFGGSGCGKSEISDRLQRVLIDNHISSYCISNDDYYSTHPLERESVRLETGVIGYRELNWKKINKVISAFKNREVAWVQEYSLFYQNTLHIKINFDKVDVLIIEGIHSARAKADYYVYLYSTKTDTYGFRLKRGKEKPNNKFRKKVIDIEYKQVREKEHKANLIVPFHKE